MRLGRRRFLAISAAFACSPGVAQAAAWTGRGFGADISITLHGPTEITRPALNEARETLEHIEDLFSLYNPTSKLSQLNRTGTLLKPGPDFLALMRASDLAFKVTEGLFDPTVQSLWEARALDAQMPEQNDWRSVSFSAEAIRVPNGQKLTFNGIAQGYATDRVTDVLASHGLTNALVNIGEFRALGGPWRLGISDPDHGLLGTRTLEGAAIATSSAAALRIDGRSHIMHRVSTPVWSTVSVEAMTATAADSLSTALTLASRDQIETIKAQTSGIRRVVLIDSKGDLTSI